MSTLRVNTIQTNTTSGIDVNSPLETVPSLDVTGNVTVGSNISVSGIVTAGSITVGSNISVSGIVTAGTFSGNLTGSVNLTTGITTVAAGSTASPSISPSGDNNTGIFFPSPDTIAFGEGGVEGFRLDSSGNISIANGNLVFSTSGKGIDFSATANSSGTMTSELLSDYEEGTWTPTITGWTGTYSIQYGRYTKIGRYVFLQCEVQTNANTGSFTQNFPGVANLPFSMDANSYRHNGTWGLIGGSPVPANGIGAGQWDATGSTALFPNHYQTNAGVGNYNSQSASATFGYRSFISYFVS